MSRTVGNYTLGTLIGRGGTSEVYAAQHRFLGDDVAVKLLRPELAHDDGIALAFVDEAARTREIVHPNVVRVLDFGRDDTTSSCYLVMERVDGETLTQRLRRGPLREAELRPLAAAIAEGVHAAHVRGIVHRDLKPANIVLRDGDHPTIIDFGIAKALGVGSAVVTSRRIGTLAYMAPEQLSDGLISPSADIWALGVIMYEAVTGKRAFDNFTDGRLPQLTEPAPAAHGVSKELARLIARCLERDPARRPASMAAVAEELRRTDALRGSQAAELAGDERFTEDLGPAPVPAPAPASAHARPQRRWLIAAGTAVVAASIVFVVSRRDRDSTASASIGSAPVRIDAPTAPPAPPPREATAAAAKPELDIRTRPAGATITIDGTPRGTTPARIAVALPVTIEVKRAGYQTVRMRALQPSLIEIDLVRIKPPATTKRDPTPKHKETLD